MSFTEHLAVVNVSTSAFAPGCYMVGIHLVKFPYAAFAAGGRHEPSPFLDKPDFWVLRIEEPPPADAVKIADVDTGGARYAIYQAIDRRDADKSAP